jgi:hypothetical protein
MTTPHGFVAEWLHVRLHVLDGVLGSPATLFQNGKNKSHVTHFLGECLARVSTRRTGEAGMVE